MHKIVEPVYCITFALTFEVVQACCLFEVPHFDRSIVVANTASLSCKSKEKLFGCLQHLIQPRRKENLYLGQYETINAAIMNKLLENEHLVNQSLAVMDI